MAWCAAHILDTSTPAVEQFLRPTVKLTALILKYFPDDNLNLSTTVNIIDLDSTNCINDRRNENLADRFTRDEPWTGILESLKLERLKH